MYAYLSMFSICLAPSSFIYIPFNLPRQSFDLIFSFEIFTHTYHPKESELFVVSKNNPSKSRSIFYKLSIFYKRSIRTIAQSVQRRLQQCQIVCISCME